MTNKARLVPPSPAHVHGIAQDLTAREFGTLRFLSVCAWDHSDDEGWINFSRALPKFTYINDDDREAMRKLENLGALEQPPNVTRYHIVRLTPTAWTVLAYVSSARYDGDPGWRKRWQPWNDNRAEKGGKKA